MAAPLERVAEDTRPVNSLSYLPMSKLTKERWSEADTDKFYYALQTVGCDFTMIAKFFDGRTRKQVRWQSLVTDMPIVCACAPATRTCAT